MKKSHILPLILLLLTIFSGEVSANVASNSFVDRAKKDLPKECMFFFRMYLNAKSPKAFAYASDDNIKYTCRFSSATNSKSKAKEVALSSCNKSRKKRGIKSECKIYNIDLKGFVSKEKFNFRNKYKLSLQKIEKELKNIQQKIEAKKSVSNLKLKKKDTLKKPKNSLNKLLSKLPPSCHIFFKLYQISPPNKAFAVAIDNDKKYVCKFSANAKTPQKAKEIALNSCKESKNKRDVKKECSIFHIYIAKKYNKSKSKPKNKIAKTISVKKENPNKIKISKSDKNKQKIIKIVKKVDKVHKKVKYKRVRNKELEKAILEANLKEIKRLIKNGADVNTEADDHSRALFVATAKGDIRFVKELLDMGADPYFKKGDGNNLLVAAIMSGKLEMLKLILDAGVDPNEQCNEGNTPLHFAFMMFDDKMMRELYKHGAVDDIPNDKGETVESMAKSYNVNLNKLKNYRDQN